MRKREVLSKEENMSNWISLDVDLNSGRLFCPACGMEIYGEDLQFCPHVMATYIDVVPELENVNPRYEKIVAEIEEHYSALAEDDEEPDSIFELFVEKTSSPSTMFMSITRSGPTPHGIHSETISVGIDFETE